MKRYFTSRIILLALTACAAPQTQELPESAATEMSQVGMPNPASVYCEHDGNTLEIVTAADGSQCRLCVFPDGSSCDEWAYFRGECGPGAQPRFLVALCATRNDNFKPLSNKFWVI